MLRALWIWHLWIATLLPNVARIETALDEIVEERLDRRSVLGGPFDDRERVLVTVAVDADRGDQHQIVADMQAIDLNDEQVELRQVGSHEGGQLFRRQGHEPARRRRFRHAAARAGRNIAFRQPHGAPEPPCRDVDQHQVHRPAPEPVLRRRPLPTRYWNLPTIDAANARPFHRNLAAVEPDPPLRLAPAVRRALFIPAVARAAGGPDIRLHHRTQRLYSGRKAKSLKALLNIGERFLHSFGDSRPRRCAISLHGVALQCGFDTPSLTA